MPENLSRNTEFVMGWIERMQIKHGPYALDVRTGEFMDWGKALASVYHDGDAPSVPTDDDVA